MGIGLFFWIKFSYLLAFREDGLSALSSCLFYEKTGLVPLVYVTKPYHYMRECCSASFVVASAYHWENSHRPGKPLECMEQKVAEKDIILTSNRMSCPHYKCHVRSKVSVGSQWSLIHLYFCLSWAYVYGDRSRTLAVFIITLECAGGCKWIAVETILLDCWNNAESLWGYHLFAKGTSS
mgnify:CR=1 FL=1